MPKECFVPKDFQHKTRAIIRKANDIIAEYQGVGFELTLRQLYYQFVARDFLANKQSEYKRLGEIINDARLAGLIDWDAIIDRTRNLVTEPSWSDPAAIISSAAHSYQENLWDTQPAYVEVWIEKDALVGVIERICEEWRLPYFACRGYSSQSEMYSAGKRLERQNYKGKEVIILHLGDHDPSGVQMSEDNENRLTMFADEPIELRRIALNMDQIRLYNPPPNPAKETDSRIEGYRSRFGTNSSWELDALDPRVISELIRTEVTSIIDHDLWEKAVRKEEWNKETLQDCYNRWDFVSQQLRRDPDVSRERHDDDDE